MKIRVLVLPAVGAFLMSACERAQVDPTGPPSLASSVEGPKKVGPKRARPSEELQWEFVRDEPTIGGVHMDSEGNTVILVTEPARSGRALAVAERMIQNGRIPNQALKRGRRILTKKAEFTFQQLSDWRELVSDSLLGRFGVVMSDLDEVRNRITLGVMNDAQNELIPLKHRLTDLGIPITAVNFKATSIPRAASASPSMALPFTPNSLTSQLNPSSDSLGGGISHGTTYETCSTSVVADRGGERGFITASHCTEIMFNPDSSNVGQPQLFSSYPVIGFDAADPYPVTCDWWEQNVTPGCDDKRPADAAFIKLTGSLKGRRGAIARTQNRVSGTGASLLVNTSNPWINVTSQQSSVMTGWTLDKIGLRTGWTYGTVSGTCIDGMTEEQGKTHLIYCLDSIDLHLGRGDSGGPVFMYDGADGAIYFGVVSLLDPQCSDLCNGVFYSSIGQIQQDLGTVNTVTEITMGSLSVSGSIDWLGQPQLSWSAVTTTNTTATTVYKIYRAVWDASTNSWADPGGLVATITGTSYADGGLNWPVSEFTGDTEPAECVYSYSYYWVVAYNAGVKRVTNWMYFRGPADGMTPGEFQCQ